MSEPGYRAVVHVIAGRRGRVAVRASLRRACLATLITLVVQFGLGMALNLYVPVPAADGHAGYIQEILTAPLALTAHALLGVVLIGNVGLVMILAIASRDKPTIALAAGGLLAIAGAFAAGEVFVRDGQSAASFAMAVLTGVALVCYIAAYGRFGAVPRQTHLPVPPPLRLTPPVSNPRPRLEFPAPGPWPHSGSAGGYPGGPRPQPRPHPLAHPLGHPRPGAPRRPGPRM